MRAVALSVAVRLLTLSQSGTKLMPWLRLNIQSEPRSIKADIPDSWASRCYCDFIT